MDLHIGTIGKNITAIGGSVTLEDGVMYLQSTYINMNSSSRTSSFITFKCGVVDLHIRTPSINSATSASSVALKGAVINLEFSSIDLNSSANASSGVGVTVTAGRKG